MLRFEHFLAIFFIIGSSTTLISFTPEAFSQSYSTYLTLELLPSQVSPGDTITFRGVLGTSDGYVITDATIYIKDDVDFGTDTILGTVVTDAKGEFTATWTAQTRSGGGSYDFYAIYEGGSNFAKARSQTYSVFVSGSPSGYTPPPSSGSTSPTYYPTSITLDRVPSSVYTDQTVTFTGKLTSNGNPLSKALVKIMEDDPFKPDQLLVRGFTDSGGRFSLTWDVTGGYVETDFDVYATFDTDGTYAYARSYNQVISVLRYGGSIALDPFQSSAQVGDMIIFSGTLKLNKGSPEGAVVYIKDEDPFSADDLLATAYVDRDGRYSANWFVNYADPDNVVDVYAVFEGNDVLYRQTTCDSGPTMPIGSSCSNIIPLRVYGTLPPTPIPPPDEGITVNEYMVLYYSLDFPTAPQVAIVPSPDSYDNVRSHIIPVEEGILMWKSQLENKYGGNWNVNFEVISPGTLFFQKKPDVIVNLVDFDKEIDCSSEFVGLAKVTGIKPIQTWTCSSYKGKKLSNSDVAATSAHEFIHAVGLGHTFGLAGDLMCSVENGKATCPGFSKSNTPSNLNLDATVKLYGTDGFKNPNNRVTSGTKFYGGDSNGGSPTNQPTIEPIKPIPPTITPVPPTITTDGDGDGILDRDDSCPTNLENYNGYQDTDGCPDKKPTALDELSELLKDSDSDGIVDSKDKCRVSPENYNGYLDSDGCPDSKPEPYNWELQSLKFQNMINSKILVLKPGITTAERSLYDAEFESPEAQKEVKAAWTKLWWAKKYLDDSEFSQKEGEVLISKQKFEEAFYKYKYSLDKSEKIEEHLLEITSHLNNAESLELKNKQETTQQAETTEERKTCFLFWCW